MRIWENDYVCLLLFNITTKLFYHIFNSDINVVSSGQYAPLLLEPGALLYKNDFLIHHRKEHTGPNRNYFERSRKSYGFSSTISCEVAAHRFSPLGYPGGIEATFFPKTNTFLDSRKEVIPWRYFAFRKPATTR